MKKNNDFTHLNKYHNEWVAIDRSDRNRVVGEGKTAQEALRQARNKKIVSPILTKVPSNYGTFVL